jgi:hypothetical protein
MFGKKAQSSFHFRAQCGKSSSFDKETGEPGDLFEQVMSVQRRLQIMLSRAAPRPDAGADRALHHAHMPVPPCTELLIDLQELMKHLEGQLEDRVTPV